MRRYLCAAFVLLTSLAARAQYVDSVTMNSDKDVQGEVQKVSYKEVVLVLPGTSSTFTVTRDQIKGDINWDESSIPPPMANGRAQFASGKYSEAATSFAKAIASAGTRGVLKQECSFKLAECNRMSGNFGEAALAYQKLLKDFPETFYIKQVYTYLVDCMMFSSPPNFAAARTAIKDITDKAKELGLDEEFVGDLKLKDARMFERQNQFAQAEGGYTGMTSHKIPRIQWAAYAGLGACQMIAKENDKAKSSFQKVIDNADRSQSSSLARAYNGLGEGLLVAGSGNAAEVKEALLCFLRTVVLYPPGANDLTDDHAKAMMLAARCYHKLADLETAEDVKEKLGGEYQRLVGRFMDNYGGDYPDWAKKIKEPL